MHRKAVFFLAGVFLTIALVVPPIVIVLQTESSINDIIIARNDPGSDTGGNITALEIINANRQRNLVLIGVIEIVFAILFVIALWYGINH
jgi:hypothetical protein